MAGLKPKSEENRAIAEQLCSYLPGASYRQWCRVVKEVLSDPKIDDYVISRIGIKDRFFLLTCILNRPDALHHWLFERCREVEEKPNGYIDLWARGHYKSTIITFAGAIQAIARDPEITIGIFSHTRPIAKAFLAQIKFEAEQNDKLSIYYPDSFWKKPEKESPAWSLDSGLLFKRKTNPKEKTIEAWGVVKGQPVSKHFRLMIYDDVVTEDSVSNAEMIQKTTKYWELSLSLTAKEHDVWMIGTRYNFLDTYRIIMDRGAAIPRIYPATDTGTPDGNPVFLTDEQWEDKKKKTPGRTLACQMLQNPIAGEEQEFKPEWIRRYEVRPEVLNVAICVDPANSKKGDACNSAFAVIGYDQQRNKYLLDGACHRMSLSERWDMLKSLRRKWLTAQGIGVVVVGYERYGMQADIQYFEEMMRIDGNHFPIQEVSWVRDGEQAKDDRIRRLIPDHQNWRFFYPYNAQKHGETSLQARTIAQGKKHLVARPIKRRNHDGQLYDLVQWFTENEYLFFPATTLKDFLDAMSRVYDLENFNPPQFYRDEMLIPEHEDY